MWEAAGVSNNVLEELLTQVDDEEVKEELLQKLEERQAYQAEAAELLAKRMTEKQKAELEEAKKGIRQAADNILQHLQIPALDNNRAPTTVRPATLSDFTDCLKLDMLKETGPVNLRRPQAEMTEKSIRAKNALMQLFSEKKRDVTIEAPEERSDGTVLMHVVCKCGPKYDTSVTNDCYNKRDGEAERTTNTQRRSTYTLRNDSRQRCLCEGSSKGKGTGRACQDSYQACQDE